MPNLVDSKKFEFPIIIPVKPTWLTPDTWLVSDTHFNHLNIIRYCNRPSEWQINFIHHWQNTVLPKDKVLHLGDVIFGCSKQESADFMSLLPGEKHLIMGNHDRGQSWMKDIGFCTPQRKPIIAEFPEHILVFSHHPLIMENIPETTKRVVNIHGHIHNNPSPFTDEELHFNISIEVMGYRLNRLSEILKII